MNETWKLAAKLRSGVLLIDESRELKLSGDNLKIHFARPTLVNNPTWANYNHVIPQATWDYKISIYFPAKDEKEAKIKALRKLESITSRLSFIGSSPVTIE